MPKSWNPPLPPAKEFKKQSLKELCETADFIYQIGEFLALREKSKSVQLTGISSPQFQAKLTYLRSCLKKYRLLIGKGRGVSAV